MNMNTARNRFVVATISAETAYELMEKMTGVLTETASIKLQEGFNADGTPFYVIVGSDDEAILLNPAATQTE